MSKTSSNGEKKQVQDKGTVMDKEYDVFCKGLDQREKEKSICHYPDAARRFLWNELRGKTADVRDAVKKWVVSGKKTTLSVPELTVPDGFWCQSLAASEKSQNKTAKEKRTAISTEMLENARKMNYIASAFAIDWLRREPRKALMVLHRGMI